MGSRNLWVKMLPLTIGTRIKVIRDTCKVGRLDEIPLGSRGVILYYVDISWKRHMIVHKCYPRSILRETMYAISFPKIRDDGTEFAYRWFELEVY